jgi:hypothetical protein
MVICSHSALFAKRSRTNNANPDCRFTLMLCAESIFRKKFAAVKAKIRICFDEFFTMRTFYGL